MDAVHTPSAITLMCPHCGEVNSIYLDLTQQKFICWGCETVWGEPQIEVEPGRVRVVFEMKIS